MKVLDLRMCHRDPYNSVAVQLLSEIAIDILPPLDFLGPEDTEKSRDAGFFMFATMLTMWEPCLPCPCYSGDDNSEGEEKEEDEVDDYEDDNNDEEDGDDEDEDDVDDDEKGDDDDSEDDNEYDEYDDKDNEDDDSEDDDD